MSPLSPQGGHIAPKGTVGVALKWKYDVKTRDLSTGYNLKKLQVSSEPGETM